MGNITLAIPDTMFEEIKSFSEIKWSEVARTAIAKKLETLRLANKLAEKSKLTQKDIDNFSKMLKQESNKRFLK